jgi:hypothetical protein
MPRGYTPRGYLRTCLSLRSGPTAPYGEGAAGKGDHAAVLGPTMPATLHRKQRSVLRHVQGITGAGSVATAQATKSTHSSAAWRSASHAS